MTIYSSRLKNTLIISMSYILLLANVSIASEILSLKGEKDRTSYSVGYQIGEDLAKQKAALKPEAFLGGVEDALSDTVPRYSANEMQAALGEIKKKIAAGQRAKQTEKRAERLSNKEKYIGEGREFLARNAELEGVVTLPSGLQYKILEEGSGKKPGLHDTVVINYRGTLIDGAEFGSSYRKGAPEKRRVDGMVPGMKEALQLMQEGAKWRLFVPSDLAYGERGPLADRTVIIEMELVSVETQK